jgi:hypothetical protein
VIVDAVDGIVRVTRDQIAQLPQAANREFGEDIATVGDRLLVLIDPERVALDSPPASRRKPGKRGVEPIEALANPGQRHRILGAVLEQRLPQRAEIRI